MRALYWLVGGALLAGALVYGGYVRVSTRAADPSIVQINGGEWQVKLLFEHDGCKMYQAYAPQAGFSLYWTKCSGTTNQVSWNTSEFDPATETTVPKSHSVTSTNVK